LEWGKVDAGRAEKFHLIPVLYIRENDYKRRALVCLPKPSSGKQIRKTEEAGLISQSLVTVADRGDRFGSKLHQAEALPALN
jgi:hypothetical protein